MMDTSKNIHKKIMVKRQDWPYTPVLTMPIAYQRRCKSLFCMNASIMFLLLIINPAAAVDLTWAQATTNFQQYSTEGWNVHRPLGMHNAAPNSAVDISHELASRHFRNKMLTFSDIAPLHALNLFGYGMLINDWYWGAKDAPDTVTDLHRTYMHVQSEVVFRTLHRDYKVMDSNGDLDVLASGVYNSLAIMSSKIGGAVLYTVGLSGSIYNGTISGLAIAAVFTGAGIGGLSTALADQISLIPAQRVLAEASGDWTSSKKVRFFLWSRMKYAKPVTAGAAVNSIVLPFISKGEPTSVKHVFSSVITANLRQLMYVGTFACKIYSPAPLGVGPFCDVAKHGIALGMGTYVGFQVDRWFGLSDELNSSFSEVGFGRRRMWTIEDRGARDGNASLPAALGILERDTRFLRGIF